MNSQIKHDAELIEERAKSETPNAWRRCWPRKYDCSNQYLSPVYTSPLIYSGVLANALKFNVIRDHSSASAQFVVNKLLEYDIPTYFVDEHFIRAVAATDPPEDMTLGEINWPMDALLFVLPLEFMKSYTGGWFAPFMMGCRVPKGIYLPPPVGELSPKTTLESPNDRFCFDFPVYFEGKAVDYTTTFQLDKSLKEIASAAFEDFTKSDYLVDFATSYVSADKLPTPDQDKDLHWKMNSLMMKLLLALHAEPEYLEKGKVLRPLKVKHGKTKVEICSPNFIGRKYSEQVTYKYPAGNESGYHVRMHWRRGHMRHQVYGKGRSERKLIWVKPVLVNSDLKV